MQRQDEVCFGLRRSTWVAVGWKVLEALCLAAFCLVCVVIYQALTPAAPPVEQLSAKPAGVNFGGWLCLEDWFFSGIQGQDVASAHPDGQGACLPPALQQLDAPWPSEGNLTYRLNASLGPGRAAGIFEAHRHSFITEQDLQDLSNLGIRLIRLPLTWAAFADALAPVDSAVYGKHSPELDTAIVPDPFYASTAMFATVPRSWLKQFLERCANHGLQVLFDLHAFPGGSSDGTYNGVWPSPPAFWLENASIGDTNVSLAQTGLWVAQALIQWVEGLEVKALGAVYGVSLMNEPAHMAAHQAPGKGFIKSEQQVLTWLAAAADLFRKSQLPGRGKKLFVQLIETAFQKFDDTAVPWFKQTFSDDEQKSWAVIDLHKYMAWDPACDGLTKAGGSYFCDQPLDDTRVKLRSCIGGWASGMASTFTGLKACTEFSLGTFSGAIYACNDPQVLQVFLQEQVSAFKANDIQSFFWTWRMPFGKVFEPGWSLKYQAGLETGNAEQCFALPKDPNPPPYQSIGVKSPSPVQSAYFLDI